MRKNTLDEQAVIRNMDIEDVELSSLENERYGFLRASDYLSIVEDLDFNTFHCRPVGKPFVEEGTLFVNGDRTLKVIGYDPTGEIQVVAKIDGTYLPFVGALTEIPEDLVPFGSIDDEEVEEVDDEEVDDEEVDDEEVDDEEVDEEVDDEESEAYERSLYDPPRIEDIGSTVEVSEDGVDWYERVLVGIVADGQVLAKVDPEVGFTCVWSMCRVPKQSTLFVENGHTYLNRSGFAVTVRPYTHAMWKWTSDKTGLLYRADGTAYLKDNDLVVDVTNLKFAQ